MGTAIKSSAPQWLVFADDWGRHPSSCQYLVRELMHAVDVTWVNTIGMRTPRLDRATLVRTCSKVRSCLRPATTDRKPERDHAAPAPRILNPPMWPWFTRRLDRRINRWLLRKSLSRAIQDVSRPRIAITTIPIVADLIGVLPVDRWVYYCVDDFAVWPGLDQATLLWMERELINSADHIITVSEVLQHRIRSLGRQSTLLTHGVDIPAWNLAGVTPFEWPAEVKSPVALFWGLVDRRLDTDFVLSLAQQFEGTLVLVGPQQGPDSRIAKCEQVVMLPPVATSELAGMARAATCLIMPYSNSPVTRAMQPLKLKEYLATGKPVVARRTPATQDWADACDLVDSPAEFVTAVRRYWRDGPISVVQTTARSRLSYESWSSKAEEFFAQVMGTSVGSQNSDN
ncbi:MAG: glycosyltransferase [Pirellulaceae bacterium]